MPRKYKKILINRFQETGGLNKLPSNVIDIAILPKTKEFTTKLSLELSKPEIKGPEGKLKSFRTDNIVTIENIIKSLCQGLGYFACEKGTFGDGFDKIDKKNLDVKVEDFLRHLYNKIRESVFDGIRSYDKEEQS